MTHKFPGKGKGLGRSALRFASGVSLVAAAAILAGCAFTGTNDIANPVTRKATWFSFLNADDLRTACDAGQADGWIRLVYNARYYDETRSFDLSPAPDGSDRFEMTSRIFGPIDVSSVDVTVNAPLGAFGGDEVRKTISRDDYLALTDALQQDGFGYQSRDGLRLNSNDYYWVAIGCSTGNVTLAAWTSASDDLGGLHFPDVVAQISGQTSPLPQPPSADAPKLPDPVYGGNDRKNDGRDFYRTVRGNMLR
ncbi:hypothetical protein [Thalassospira sp.]|uniref:hypothetical protein n=1 Tax=Thalassospira sp. TaxID=1912094 RepID=UPI0027334C8D|nr:hypothetical protein [Thalassospira sp.]MDP2700098.1 hypothetical protein [Thalassospira sp.]